MTTTDCTVIFAAIAAYSSFAAAVFAVITFVRTVSWQAPTVDFLVNDCESKWASHRLIISNPTRSVLVLEYVKVLCPRPETVTIEPAHLDHKGTTDRAYEQLELGSKTTKPVFLSVPPGETEKGVNARFVRRITLRARNTSIPPSTHRLCDSVSRWPAYSELLGGLTR